MNWPVIVMLVLGYLGMLFGIYMSIEKLKSDRDARFWYRRYNQLLNKKQEKRRYIDGDEWKGECGYE